MPALDLLLKHHNAKINETLNTADPDPDYREPVEFKDSEEMSAFKKQYIHVNKEFRRYCHCLVGYFAIIGEQMHVFDAWIRAVDSYKGTDFLCLNPKIPPEAVVKKEEHRQIPFRERKVFNMTSFADEDHEKVRAEVQGKADIEV